MTAVASGLPPRDPSGSITPAGVGCCCNNGGGSLLFSSSCPISVVVATLMPSSDILSELRWFLLTLNDTMCENGLTLVAAPTAPSEMDDDEGALAGNGTSVWSRDVRCPPVGHPPEVRRPATGDAAVAAEVDPGVLGDDAECSPLTTAAASALPPLAREPMPANT